MPEDKSINQSRLGVDGAGGVKKTGQFLSRSNVRVYYVGGMAALGLAWFFTSWQPISSKLDPVTSKAADLSRGGKLPTGPSSEATEGPRLQTGPKVPSPHGGVAAAQSEGAKPKF